MMGVRCAGCGGPLEGKARQARYCSTACQRAREYRRRHWDRAARWAETNVLDPDRTPGQRDAWIGRSLGPRP